MTLVWRPGSGNLLLKNGMVITGREAGPADPYIGNVSLLLHGDGDNGSTTIIDSSPSPKTVTAFGDAQISTAQSKFGGSSIAFDGTGDYLESPQNADFSFGSGAFTIEFWFFTGQTSSGTFVSHRSGPGAGSTNWLVTLGVPTQGKVGLYLSSGSAYGVPGLSTTSSVTDNQWHHYAATRSGSTIRVFLDGVQESTTIWEGTVSETPRVLQVGYDSSASYLDGYIDDLRITKGVARYTSNFTPPTAPFPDI